MRRIPPTRELGATGEQRTQQSQGYAYPARYTTVIHIERFEVDMTSRTPLTSEQHPHQGWGCTHPAWLRTAKAHTRQAQHSGQVSRRTTMASPHAYVTTHVRLGSGLEGTHTHKAGTAQWAS
eukprot:1162031-Pelagomonas_calceolata.AAC.3